MTGDAPVDERPDVEPVEIIIVPVADDEELVLGRHQVMAAHARAGAIVALDLTELEPGEIDLPRVLADLVSTTSGNRQRLVVVGGKGADGGYADGGYADLATCLLAEAPVTGKAFGLIATVPARMSYVQPLRQHLVAAVRSCHGDKEAFQAELLVDELAVNAVENSPSSRNAWDLRFTLEHHHMLVEVTNDFDEAVDSARIMNRRLQSFDDSGRYMGERGRGLFLVARMADGLQIRAMEGDRVRVSVNKKMGRS